MFTKTKAGINADDVQLIKANYLKEVRHKCLKQMDSFLSMVTVAMLALSTFNFVTLKDRADFL